jgi:ethanolamine utilization protein EutA (predicted chaperonin)
LLSRVQRDGTVIKKHISISKALRDQGIGREPIRPGDVIIATENPALQAARPAAIALMTVAGAILVLYVAARIKNINVQTGTNTSNPTANTNVRVAIPSL